MRLVQCCVKFHFIVFSIGYYKAEDCVKVRSQNIPILKPRNRQYATEQATNIPHGTESSTHNITSRYF